MSRSARNSRGTRSAAVAMLLPLLMLGACANRNEEAMAEKLAAAEAAADKAVAAKEAAEKAALIATSSRPAAEAASVSSFDDDSHPDNPEDLNNEQSESPMAEDSSGTEVSGTG